MLLSDLNQVQQALIDPADQIRLGLVAPVSPVAVKIDRREHRLEKQEQQRLCGWLRLHAISFDQDRMDKRRTGTRGWPDFAIVHQGRVLLGELKRHGHKPSPAQQKRFGELFHNGTEVQLWHSFEEARRQVMNWFWTEFRISLPDELL